MRNDSRLERLSTVPLFATCSKAELRRIAPLVDRLDIARGEVLCRQGAAGASELFVIESGTARAEIDGTLVGDLGPGDTIGEMALLDRGPRSATVTATSDMIVYSLGAREFATVLTDVPAIGRRILEVLGERLMSVQGATVA